MTDKKKSSTPKEKYPYPEGFPPEIWAKQSDGWKKGHINALEYTKKVTGGKA